jgi:predicted double-glycine peptidase
VNGIFARARDIFMQRRSFQTQHAEDRWLKRKGPLFPGFITLILGVTFLLGAPPNLFAGEVQMFLPGGGIYNKQVTSFKERRMLQMVPQTSDYSCGAAAMATLLRYQFGQEVTEKDAILGMFEHGDKEGIRKRGFSMLDMKHFVLSRGLKAAGYKITDVSTLGKLNIPVITLIQTARYKHFVVLRGMDNRFAYLADPAWGNRKMPLGEFSNSWDHVILLISGPVKGTPEGLYSEAKAAGLPKDWVLRNDEALGVSIALDPTRSMYNSAQIPSAATLPSVINTGR